MTKHILSAAFLLLPTLLAAQTPISGVINHYARVQSIDTCAARLRVGTTEGFAPGQAVFILQMKGATVRTDETDAFGQVTNLGGAGRYERNRVADISGSDITLAYRLINSYDPAGDVQLVTLPEYEAAVVTGQLTALPWNGATGGVLALAVRGRLTLEAAIDVSGLGFRGGPSVVIEETRCDNIFLRNPRDYGLNRENWRGAPKGEGIADAGDKPNGRGPMANGGGGGNDHNAGGGGGANLTAGGQGGENRQPGFGCDGNFPGLGGRALPADAARLFLGGGGGGGHENNNVGTDGGNGGGIVLLLADEIVAANDTIRANGQTPAATTGDGGGGGGGGGAIVIQARLVSGALVAEARGGDGGRIDNRNEDRCIGPGGGGGGGRILLSAGLTITTNVGGGTAGRSTNSTACPDGANNAANGAAGRVDSLSGLPAGTRPAGPPAIADQPAAVRACAGDTARLSVAATGSAVRFQWQIDEGAGFVDISPGDPRFSGARGAELAILPNSGAPPASPRFRLRIGSDCYADVLSNPITTQFIAAPRAAFAVNQQDPSVTFVNQSQDADTYHWDFGDGSTAAEINPLHTYAQGGTYLVTLIAAGACGADTARQEIVILQAPTAAFSASPTQGCTPLTVQFQDQSSAAPTSRQWRFPGGTPATAADANPVVRYTTPGRFDVELIVANQAGRDTLRQTGAIVVAAPPRAAFAAAVTDLEVRLTNSSQNAASYRWEFGDGNTSTETSPVHTYAQSGAYLVTLIASGACGADTARQEIVILQAPTAAFSASPAEGCTPLTVQFQDRSSAAPTSRQWRFPGGTPATATDANPVVRYSDPGRFDVELIVANQAGRDTLRQTGAIVVAAPPRAAFTAAVTNLEVRLTNTSQNAAGYRWDFGDGAASTDASPAHTYAQGGTYTVTLIAAGECGADTARQQVVVLQAPTARFSASPSEGCTPLTVQFSDLSIAAPTARQWRFPGGTPATATDANPVVRYPDPGRFDVELIVANQAGRDTLRQTGAIVVAAPPRAAFAAAVTNLEVRLTNTSQNAVSYRWDFGDGDRSTEAAPVHVYALDGRYDIQLIAEGPCGSDTIQQRVAVGQPLRAAFQVDRAAGCAPHVVQFSSAATGAVNTLRWQFPGGEPATSTDTNPRVIYRRAGVYPVVLTVRDAFGDTSRLQRDSAVRVRDYPEAAFTYEFRSEREVAFTNHSSGADTYRWNFGDGLTSTEADPVHTFDRSGVFEVTLNAQNGSCASAASRTIVILLTATEPVLPPSLLLFPNPTDDVLYLRSTAPGLWPMTCTLYSAAGARILQATLSGDGVLDLSRMPAGVYLLQLRNGQGQWVARVVRQ